MAMLEDVGVAGLVVGAQLVISGWSREVVHVVGELVGVGGLAVWGLEGGTIRLCGWGGHWGLSVGLGVAWGRDGEVVGLCGVDR